jgi:hypothetical protein
MIPTFVVVFGNANNGKDAFADVLARHLEPARGVVLRCSFADPLKEAALHMLGIPRRVSYGPASVKEGTSYYGKTARHWLQWLGTEVGREQVHPALWVHRLADRGLESGARFVVVSDGRFENERVGLRDYLRGRGLVFNVLVHRPSLPIPGPDAHPSEAEVADMRRRVLLYGGAYGLFDAVVANAGALADLDFYAEAVARLVP